MAEGGRPARVRAGAERRRELLQRRPRRPDPRRRAAERSGEVRDARAAQGHDDVSAISDPQGCSGAGALVETRRGTEVDRLAISATSLTGARSMATVGNQWPREVHLIHDNARARRWGSRRAVASTAGGCGAQVVECWASGCCTIRWYAVTRETEALRRRQARVCAFSRAYAGARAPRGRLAES